MNNSCLPKPKLRWYQFSLRTLLVFVVLCAIPCSWIAVRLESSRRQQAVVAKLEHRQGNVKTRYGNVVKISLNHNTRDEDLVHLQVLTELEYLSLDGASLTDAGLVHLENLTKLRDLSLDGRTRLTDAGLVHLKGLTKLETLYVRGPNFTDAGLVSLAGLTRLRELTLRDTQVTGAGLGHLKNHHTLTVLQLWNSPTDDAGLEHVQLVRSLERLELSGFQVTGAGLDRFAQVRPNVTVATGYGERQGNCLVVRQYALDTDVPEEDIKLFPEHLKGQTTLKHIEVRQHFRFGDAELVAMREMTKLETLLVEWAEEVTDAGLTNLKGMTGLTKLTLIGAKITDAGLKHLEVFDNLRYLDIEANQVTDEGVKKLQQALPNCKVHR